MKVKKGLILTDPYRSMSSRGQATLKKPQYVDMLDISKNFFFQSFIKKDKDE